MNDRAPLTSQPTKLLYVVGSGRSGSSLFDVLMGAHPMVSSAGEVHRLCLDPATRVCACGSTLDDCDRWESVRRVLAHRLGVNLPSWSLFKVSHDAYDHSGISHAIAGAMCLAPIRPDGILSRANSTLGHLRASAAASWELFDAMTAAEGTQMVVDSTKTAARMRFLAAARPRDIYVLHLVRDGRAVAASEMRRTGSTMRQSATTWRNTLAKTDLMLRRIPSAQKMELKYENLCADPLNSINSVLRFAGLTEFTELHIPDTFHTIPGNPMLLTGIDSIRLDTQWKSQLDSGHLTEFSRVASRTMRRHGYLT